MKKRFFQNPLSQKKENYNYYEVLEVLPTADENDILKSYIRLTTKYKRSTSSADREQLVKVDRAYKVLSNPNRRSAYDRYLLSGGTGDRSAFELPGGHTSENEYANSSQSFNAHTGSGSGDGNGNRNGMSEKGLNMTKRIAGVTGGVVGAVVGSKIGRKVAGKAGGFTRVILETSGSLVGSAVGSDASRKMVQNVHDQKQSNNSRGGLLGIKDAFTKTAHEVNDSSPQVAQNALTNGYVSNAQGTTNRLNHKAARTFGGGC